MRIAGEAEVRAAEVDVLLERRGKPLAGTAVEAETAGEPAATDNESVWRSPTAPTVRGGKAIFGELGDVDSLNPYTHETVFASYVIDQIFLRLQDEQPDYHQGPPSFEPRLIESWEAGADGKSIMRFSFLVVGRECFLLTVWSGLLLKHNGLAFAWIVSKRY